MLAGYQRPIIAPVSRCFFPDSARRVSVPAAGTAGCARTIAPLRRGGYGDPPRKSRSYAAVLGIVAAVALAAASAQAQEFTPGPMLKQFLAGPMDGVDEIVFAVRGQGGDGHWYANFGYHISNPDAMQYGPPGGRLCRLNLRTGELKVIFDDPKGGVRDPVVHYDGTRILFSYRRGNSRHYHLCEINADGTALRQLTDGPFDELEPIYLPDGDIVFCSSRCNRWVQCWFTQVAILYRCGPDGQNQRPISANVEQDNTPWVMPDGRILYMRWEYVDRSRVQFHHLWTVNPDGAGQMTYFGNLHPGTVMLDAKPIPGSPKVVVSFSPGHGRKEHAGHITVVSPDAGPDALPMTRRITAEADWRDPWAFSEECFMAARDGSLYVIDGAGKAEQFYILPPDLRRLAVHEPRPLLPHKREPVIAARTNPAEPVGRILMADILHGRNMEGVRPGEIRSLLVLETLPKPVNFSGTMEPISLGGTFTLPRILGTVPVEPDGSAYFEAPALRPLYFVALDERGLAVKRMQSFVSLMPGETAGCSGCHEKREEAARGVRLGAAVRRPPSSIKPLDGVPQVFDFPRDIQPILDRHCTGCHNDGKFAGRAVLTADRGPWYSHAYATLMSRGQVSHGRDAQGNLPPRGIGSSASPLMEKVLSGHNDVKLSDREKQLVSLWIDAGAPYPGTYAALGSGMVGWRPPEDVIERRCGSCHQAGNAKEWARRFRTHEDLLANLTRPDRSLILLAPLARSAGGLGLCVPKGAAEGTDSRVLASKADPAYAAIAATIHKAKASLDGIKRFDMAGFVPNRHYIREMQRYGVLPADFDPAAPDRPINPYETDERYWRSFWYTPEK